MLSRILTIATSMVSQLPLKPLLANFVVLKDLLIIINFVQKNNVPISNIYTLVQESVTNKFQSLLDHQEKVLSKNLLLGRMVLNANTTIHGQITHELLRRMKEKPRLLDVDEIRLLIRDLSLKVIIGSLEESKLFHQLVSSLTLQFKESGLTLSQKVGLMIQVTKIQSGCCYPYYSRYQLGYLLMSELSVI